MLALAFLHALVDASALLIAPLWPGIEAGYGLSFSGLSAAFIVQSLPTNLSQVIFGWWRDRRPMPVWIWLGPAIGAVTLPLMGVASSTALLFALLTVGGIGVGAFHPESAVAVGRLAPYNRTRALSIFMLGGSLGMTAGPLISGVVVSRYGLGALAWAAPILLLGIGALRRAIVLPPAPPRPDIVRHQAFGGRTGLAVALLAICSLRLVPNMAMDKVLAYMISARDGDVAEIGALQSLFLGSACLGMFLMAVGFRGRREKPILVMTPLLCAPLLAAMSWSGCPRLLFLLALALQGIVLWGTTPAMVSYAQRQFPSGAGLASALTMGLSWGVAGLIQAPITVWFRSRGEPEAALLMFVPCLLLSSLGAAFLPDETQSPSSSDESAAATGSEARDAFPKTGMDCRVFGKSPVALDP